MVHDAVGDCRRQCAVGQRQPLGVDVLEADAVGKVGPLDVAGGQREHRLGEIDRHDPQAGILAAKFDRNLRGAGAQVEHFDVVWQAGRGEGCQKVGGEAVVHLAVIHRVVVAGFVGRVHHLGLEDAAQQ